MSRTMIAAGALLVLLLAGALPAAGDWVGELCATGLLQNGEFGFAVAVADNGTIAVGDYRHDVVYLFDRDGNGHCRRHDPIRGEPGSWFGFALAIHDRQLLIGAPRPGGTGAAYLYNLDRERLPLALPPAQRGDELGSSVAISGDALAIGARGTDSRRGRVYYRSGGVFQAVPIEGLAPNAELGQSVALSGKTLVMGAPSPYHNSGSPGAAWVLEIGGDAPHSLTPPGGLKNEAAFGYAVAVSGGDILVGAPLADEPGKDAGAVYVFSRSNDWKLAGGPQPLLAGRPGDQLGVAVALEGRTAVIGARYAEGNRGAVWLAGLSGGAQTLRPRETVPGGAQLGVSVAIRKGLVVAGAFRQESTGAAYAFVPAIRLELEDDEVSESDKTVRVKVRSDEPVPRDVTVRISTEDGSAKVEDGDYRELTISEEIITLPAGQREVTKDLPILQDDQKCEPKETFSLVLFDPPEGEAVQEVTVTIRDDDKGGLELSPAELRTSEDGTPAPLSIRLTCPPFAQVKVSLEGPAGFSPASLTFKEEDENWKKWQIVNVTGPDDDTCETVDISYSVRATTTSEDTRYAGLSRTVFAENADDELACLTVPERAICSDGSTVVYTISFANEVSDGPGAPAELRDVLPPGVTVVTASADSGIATADPIANSVLWTGTVPPEGVTITIVAALDELPGPVLANRADLAYIRDRQGHQEVLRIDFAGVEIESCP